MHGWPHRSSSGITSRTACTKACLTRWRTTSWPTRRATRRPPSATPIPSHRQERTALPAARPAAILPTGMSIPSQRRAPTGQPPRQRHRSLLLRMAPRRRRRLWRFMARRCLSLLLTAASMTRCLASCSSSTRSLLRRRARGHSPSRPRMWRRCVRLFKVLSLRGAPLLLSSRSSSAARRGARCSPGPRTRSSRVSTCSVWCCSVLRPSSRSCRRFRHRSLRGFLRW
mmetsp:Transcript_35878/g.83757  ORF Transcript_35878/g.83757 Transcript_35878/m.83757 type:complete len:227 (-) Transcript_35878:1365-2045(-)